MSCMASIACCCSMESLKSVPAAHNFCASVRDVHASGVAQTHAVKRDIVSQRALVLEGAELIVKSSRVT
jgi:hypothetical protein